jgi:hypothetical protein
VGASIGGVLGRHLGFALASLAAFLAVGLLSGCGGGGSSEPTAAQLYAQQIQVGTFEKASRGIDPDELDRSGADVTTSVRQLANDRYELVIQNFSDVGYINSFWWHGENLRITGVTGSSSGTCRIADSTTLKCDGMTIAPPKCTCEPGGTATVRFTAKLLVEKNLPYPTFYGVTGSRLRIAEMTPVPYHIPSYKGGESNADLPLCAKGQASTNAKPCVHAA